ncbi:hypothetical protein D1841_02930 [Neglecta sp. X4]|nr:hypothetical protein [Neglectibacter sp. 59]NBJ72303.1 hypothetical protein [Neglectibacter sp. X4]
MQAGRAGPGFVLPFLCAREVFAPTSFRASADAKGGKILKSPVTVSVFPGQAGVTAGAVRKGAENPFGTGGKAAC